MARQLPVDLHGRTASLVPVSHAVAPDHHLSGDSVERVVDALSLRVIDSGVCLAGEDDLVTLDSLPGVIREAIDTDRLVITRR